MANSDLTFNPNLDKITEREVVPDFVSRLSIGNDFINQDDVDEDGNPKVIIPAGAKLKDDVLANMIRTFDICDIEHLDCIKTTHGKLYAGEKSIMIPMPTDNDNNNHTGYVLYRIVQESTGYDVTDCFEYMYNEVNDCSYYKATLDTFAYHDDNYKAYFYYTNDMPM